MVVGQFPVKRQTRHKATFATPLNIPEDMIERCPMLEKIAFSRPKAGFLF
jgi:hypothetical protein